MDYIAPAKGFRTISGCSITLSGLFKAPNFDELGSNPTVCCQLQPQQRFEGKVLDSNLRGPHPSFASSIGWGLGA